MRGRPKPRQPVVELQRAIEDLGGACFLSTVKDGLVPDANTYEVGSLVAVVGGTAACPLFMIFDGKLILETLSVLEAAREFKSRCRVRRTA